MRGFGQLWSAFRDWRHGPKGILLTIALFLLAIGAYYYGDHRSRYKATIDYPSHLEDTAVTVDGRALTLEDMAYYVGNREMEGQKQALRMDPDHPRSYWNTLVKGGRIVKEQTREQALQMAVHDEIFYRMAIRAGEALSGEEQQALLEHETDFWEDIEDFKGQKSLGITPKQLHAVMERIALAQRYQTIYALEKGADYEDYQYDREGYLELLKDHEYKVNKKVWERVDFGNVVADNPIE